MPIVAAGAQKPLPVFKYSHQGNGKVFGDRIEDPLYSFHGYYAIDAWAFVKGDCRQIVTMLRQPFDLSTGERFETLRTLPWAILGLKFVSLVAVTQMDEAP